jgi:hypothetical protein
MVLTSYFVLSPVIWALLTPSPAEKNSAGLTPTSRRQDHTTWPSAAVYAKGFNGFGTSPPKL